MTTKGGLSMKIDLSKSIMTKSKDLFKAWGGKVLEDVADDVYNNLMAEGVGTRDGRTPSGGAPVWDGETPTTYYPGALKEHHSKDYSSETEKNILMDSLIFYAPYVVNGSSKQRANPYHKRAVDKSLKSGAVQKAVGRLGSPR